MSRLSCQYIASTCPSVYCKFNDILSCPLQPLLIKPQIREITQTFINTAALLPPGETTEDHKESQRGEAAIVEKDKADQNPRGGLFKGRFNHQARSLAPIRDGPDGVDRCPMCTWEIEDGMCNSCGYTVLDTFPYGDYGDEDGSYFSDAQSMDSVAIEEMLADISAHSDLDSTDSGDNRPGRRHHRRFMEHIRRRAGLPLPAPVHRRRQVTSVSISSDYGDSGDDDLSEDGSLTDFVVEDMSTHDNIDGVSDLSESTSDYTSGQYGSRSERRDRGGPAFDPHPGESSDTTAVDTSFRRSRGRRIATSSPDSSEANDSDTDQSSHISSQHHGGSRSGGGFSPLQPNSENGGSQNIPIQVDSDSDDPPVRRSRRRPTAASFMSSDEEDDNARGVNIPGRPSPRNSEAATAIGMDSLPRGVARRSVPVTVTSSDGGPSPIVVGSSPAGPSFSRRLRSPNHTPRPGNTRRQGRPSWRVIMETSDDDVGERPSIPDRLAPEVAHSRSPAVSPRQRIEQRRVQRRRQKREARQRRLEDVASPRRMDQLSQPQPLAYIGV